MPLLDINTFKLKCQSIFIGNQKIEFDFINTSFNESFTFKKRDTMVLLMLINTTENEIFKFLHTIAK